MRLVYFAFLVCTVLSVPFVLENRVEFVIPVNLWDAAMFALGGYGTLVLVASRRPEPTHKLFPIALAAFGLAAVIGIFTAILNGNDSYQAVNTCRNFVAIPTGMVAGYVLPRSTRQFPTFGLVMVVAGCVIAVFVV